MKLKAVVDSLDEVDAKYHDLYVAFDDDGTERFQLDVEGVPSHPAAKALSNAHDRSKRRVRELTTEVSDLKAKVDILPEDFDADLYERAVSEGVGGGGGKIKNEEEVRREAAEAATARANAANKKVTDTLTAERDRLKARVENSERDAALDAALDAVKITDPAYRRGARALLRGSIKVIEHDGEYEALANDKDLGDIPVAEHVKTWASTEEGKAYVGPREAAGGGANGGGQGEPLRSSDINPWKAATVNVTEQARLRRENPTLASKMMREAGVIA